MATYKQNRDADWRIPYKGGWCLKYVQDAFKTDHPYATALIAWNANYGKGNHPNELPPKGKTVAVYFTLGTEPAGHVAIHLDDGYVASSTQAGTHPQGYLHPNLNDLIAVYGRYNGGCKYLGWSEYVGTVRVVEPTVANATATQIKAAYQSILERTADAGGITHYKNYPLSFVKADLLASAEYKALKARKTAQAKAAAAAKAKADAAADALAAQKAKDELAAKQKAIAAQEAAEAITSSVQNTIEENNALLKQILALLQKVVDKITSVFK